MSSDRIIVLEAIESKQQIFDLRPDKASVYMFVYALIHSNTRTLTAPWTTFIRHTCSHTRLWIEVPLAKFLVFIIIIVLVSHVLIITTMILVYYISKRFTFFSLQLFER